MQLDSSFQRLPINHSEDMLEQFLEAKMEMSKSKEEMGAYGKSLSRMRRIGPKRSE
jgi:hypothetical protein